MKDRLIEALTTGYEAVYLIDLEKDSFESLKVLNSSNAMLSSDCWSKAAKAFVEECSEDSKDIIKHFSDLELVKSVLHKSDYQDCTFRHISSDSKWRRATLQTVEYKDNEPYLVLMTVSLLGNLASVKENMFQKVLLEANDYKKMEHSSSDSQIYKMALSNETRHISNKLYDGIKVLLVEDSDILREMSKEILEQEGAIVTEAENGRRAVDIVTSGTRFDFIIMDIVMPVLDGVSATAEITEFQKKQDIKIPILGLTADANEEQKRRIIESGAYACLSKPLDPNEMSKVFISCMKENSMLMEEKIAEINLLANTDMLTHTGNIVAYTRDIGELSKELNEQKENIAIVVCDLDNLKLVNDTYGHDVGDIYIKNCCKLIRDTFKDCALYRVGGDEFALIAKGQVLPKIDEYASILNDKSRILVSVAEVINGKASVSCGYAVFDSEKDHYLNDTMKRADMAMYENKLLHRKWSEKSMRTHI